MERPREASEEMDAVRRLLRLDTCAVSDALRAGEPIGAVMGAKYEHMLKT